MIRMLLNGDIDRVADIWLSSSVESFARLFPKFIILPPLLFAAALLLIIINRMKMAPKIRRDRKSTRLNSSHLARSRMPSSA